MDRHCRLELLEGGHLIWEDAADSYAAQLADWLRRRLPVGLREEATCAATEIVMAVPDLKHGWL